MSYIKRIGVSGFRSFSQLESLKPGVPDGKAPCSGLTILVGPNNGGKSALLEAIDLSARGTDVEIPRTLRNDSTDYQSRFELEWSDGPSIVLKSNPTNSQIVAAEKKDQATQRPVFFVPIDRELPTQISQNRGERQQFVAKSPYAFQRVARPERLSERIARWRTGRLFDLLKRVLDFDWRFFTDGSAAFVKVATHEHDPRGLGYGVGALMHILDALHDTTSTSVVLIDEPEISLHPSYQRRLLKVFAEESAKVQIIYATHSPYLADWHSVVSGAVLARIARAPGDYSRIHAVRRETVETLSPMLGNLRNPHVLGTNASEVFFLQDGVILVEGQDDVVYYRKMASEVGIELEGEFYGWGAGGAGNIPKIVKLLRDLGYERVVGVLDGNRAEQKSELVRYRRQRYSSSKMA